MCREGYWGEVLVGTGREDVGRDLVMRVLDVVERDQGGAVVEKRNID